MREGGLLLIYSNSKVYFFLEFQIIQQFCLLDYVTVSFTQ